MNFIKLNKRIIEKKKYDLMFKPLNPSRRIRPNYQDENLIFYTLLFKNGLKGYSKLFK